MSAGDHLSDMDLVATNGLDAVLHSARFRKVANGYARVVAFAYDRDLKRAMADTDETVAANVAAWERGQGLEPRDWVAWGRDEEGKGDDDEIDAWLARHEAGLDESDDGDAG